MEVAPGLVPRPSRRYHIFVGVRNTRRLDSTDGADAMTDDEAVLEEFEGNARLFPLPNLVLFPHVDQGLHIFEHRYRQMTTDALASDGSIVVVLLRPEWHDDYDGRPAIERIGCLSRIVQHERMNDGRYNLVIRGLARFAIDAERPDDDKLYRLATGRILESTAPPDPKRRAELRANLREAVLARFDPQGPAFEHLAELFSGDSPLDRICDQLGYALPLPVSVKQNLLVELDVAARVGALVTALRPPPSGREFPPKFSAN